MFWYIVVLLYVLPATILILHFMHGAYVCCIVNKEIGFLSDGFQATIFLTFAPLLNVVFLVGLFSKGLLFNKEFIKGA